MHGAQLMQKSGQMSHHHKSHFKCQRWGKSSKYNTPLPFSNSMEMPGWYLETYWAAADVDAHDTNLYPVISSSGATFCCHVHCGGNLQSSETDSAGSYECTRSSPAWNRIYSDAAWVIIQLIHVMFLGSEVFTLNTLFGSKRAELRLKCDVHIVM